MEESEPQLFLLPSELIGLIADEVGPYYLMHYETVSKKWRETMWRSLTKFDLVRPSGQYYYMSESQFSQLLKKLDARRLVSFTILDSVEDPSPELAKELKTLVRLKKFSVPDLPADTITSIIPHMTGVEEIKLDSSHLKTELIEDIGDYMKHLTKLHLVGTRELGLGFPNLDKLTGLKSFQFESREKYVALEQLTALPNLETFALILLSSGPLSLERISHLKKLKKLHVMLQNSIGRQWTFLDQLPNLEYFLLFTSSNDFMNEAVEAIGRMTQLKALNFRGKIDDNTLVSHLSTLTNLESLTFDSRNIHSTKLGPLINLTRLDVSFMSENCDTLTRLTNLKQVELSFTPQINDNALQALAALPKLEILSLNGRTTSHRFNYFSSSAHLTSLSLKYFCNWIEPKCEELMDQISHLTQLVDLTIETDKDCNRLSALPNLESLVVILAEVPIPSHFSSLVTMPKLSRLELQGLGVESEAVRDEIRAIFNENSRLTRLYFNYDNL